MNPLIILVPKEAAGRIRGSGAWGRVTCKVSDAENAGYIYQVSSGPDTPLLPVDITPKRQHFLAFGEVRPSGFWYRVNADLHVLWHLSRRRTTQLTLDGFKGYVASGFVHPGKQAYIAITYAPDAVGHVPEVRIQDLVAWHVASDGVVPLDIESEPELLGNAQLVPYWPAQHLAGTTVMVVGVGSIGGAAAHALAAYGVGRLILVDPDRLRWHNLVRHVSGPAHVGRMKVSAIREDLQLLRPETDVLACPVDVVTDADVIRALLPRTDLVLGATDGVAPRRVISHLARRARVDAILACVLEDGGIGELLRLRPWRDRGCLVCQRQALHNGGSMNPEPAIDAGYGTGTRHRPMAAVGADLHLVGQLAAKAAVATILERHGSVDQKLPGDHAIVALRPHSGWAAPFDLVRTGAIRWRPGTAPIPGCPTCEDS
ncbi:ThiF family adenylyltransferase [Micromonospora sp. NPDC048835]|uniref:HesA/MoeB/ThiF family protein n=1 Tax=Micromonospora sp. NPDC048835 TaxID=3155147 RepID=UPI0033D00E3A